MESIEATELDLSNVKMNLSSSSKPSSSPSDQKAKLSDQTPWNTKTPEKPINPPRRARNSRTVMSVKDVRQASMALRKSDPHTPHKPDASLSSAEKLIASLPESSPAKPKKPVTLAKLPEKYEMLEKFFNSFDSSMRLLRIKGCATTLTNISAKVTSLTDRRFTDIHLAQLKFILPEAIEIKKILVRDERTSCMKPDLHVTVNPSAIENKGKVKSESQNGMLRDIFRARLLDFAKNHPKGDDVPEEELPEPFGRVKQDLQTSPSQFSGPSLTPISQVQPSKASHLPPSFKRGFSAKTFNPVKDITLQNTPSEAPKSASEAPESHVLATPIKEIKPAKSETDTPARIVSTPAKLMSATPTLRAPKRCYMSPEEDKSVKSPNKLVRRPSSNRSLTFETPSNDDDLDILPKDLLDSIKEKEKKVMMEKDPAISEAKRRQKMIAGLPKFFNTVYFLFQSIKRSVITKEELVHRVVSSNLDIVDKREVEEQVRLLQELVPEWIYEKFASSGDLLFCVNKIQSPELIRARLAEAI